MHRIALFLSFVTCLTLNGCTGEEDVVAPPVKDALDQIQQLDASTIPGSSPDSVTSVADEDIPQTGQYEVEFETTVGSFTVAVTREWAPRGADRFYKLVKDKFYDDCGFFRVVPGFMVQFGIAADPEKHAKWSLEIGDDPVLESNKRGYMTFATAGPNSRTSQVFINFDDNASLDSQGFSPFGKVIKGMDVVDRISAVHGEGPDQPAIESQGNSYLKSNFPDLDYVKTARITVDDLDQGADADQPETNAP